MPFALTSEIADCRSCYKCIRACPTKSISFQDGRATIIPDECVLCGHCYLACPQNAKKIRNDLSTAKRLVSSGTTYASVAPSFLASFPGSSFETLRAALISLGFAGAEETAIGATIVKEQYDQEVSRGDKDVIISTCCHSINLLVEKHFPDAVKFLSPYLSPMLAHAKDIKTRHPGAKVIFLGPCISKKNEIEAYPDFDDCVLTFIELKDWFKEKDITVAIDENPEKAEKSKARLFPVDGGILKTMDKKAKDYEYLSVSGMDEAIDVLNSIIHGDVHHAFIEMSACRGSCINGPALGNDRRETVKAYLETVRSAGKEDFATTTYKEEELNKKFRDYRFAEAIPSEKEISSILAKIGKTTKKDELNCASCGYPTCREKAIAVIRGKANLEMCLPFLMEKAKSFSNTIVKASQNGIIVLNEELSIQLVNPAMASLLGIRDPKALADEPVSSVLEPAPFALAFAGTPIVSKREYLAAYGRYCEVTITYDEQFHIIIGVYRDVTESVKRRQADEKKAAETAQITAQVIDKNMKAVQEIASLLGESAAETKIALSKLKDAIRKDNADE